MTNFLYCKQLKANGNCIKLKPFVEEGVDEIFYIPRKCVYHINSLNLIPTKNRKNPSYRLINGCPFFEPVSGLEKMLEVLGELVFSKGDYLMFEDESNYYLARDSDIFFEFHMK